MEARRAPARACWVGRGVREDVSRRFALYGEDLRAPPKALATSLRVFVASVLPGVAFGTQLDEGTGAFLVTHVLLSTAVAGVVQSLVGGNAVMIVGVAEPIVICVKLTREWLASRGEADALLPVMCAAGLFAAAFQAAVALANVCGSTARLFTRFAEETFGLLIGLLFVQAAVAGLVDEFAAPPLEGDPELVAAFQLTNGLSSTLLALLLVLATFVLRDARHWQVLTGRVRGLLADYAPLIAVAFVTAVSYGLPGALVPAGLDDDVPTRVRSLVPWARETTSNYRVLSRLHELTRAQLAGAAVVGAVFAVLFVFDHTVSSKLAPQSDQKRPCTYDWDLLVNATTSAALSVCGLPPTNGVIPQSPLHLRALMTVGDDLEVTVHTNRLTNLLQALAVLAVAVAAPAVSTIPRGVVWGYFLTIALESLPGCQFAHRLSLMLAKRKAWRGMHLGDSAPAFTDPALVSTREVEVFTTVQLAALACVYGITWAGYAGLAFPLAIVLLVPFRHYVLPLAIPPAALAWLDATEDVEEVLEEVPPEIAEEERRELAALMSGEGRGPFSQLRRQLTSRLRRSAAVPDNA